jgi:Mrp family chromosome partitioning ATPase
MPTKEQIFKSLEAVIVPSTKRSIIRMNLVRDIVVAEDKITVVIASTGLVPEAQNWIKEKVQEAVKQFQEVKIVDVEYKDAKAKELNSIDRVIAVMSGKGGVGKSLVSSLVAVGLKRLGCEVGILDGDITGPSIPRMFGIRGMPGGNESAFMPVVSKSGIEIMSINLLLPDEEEAVIWRGPLIGKTITQFWEDVLWGKLDYLVVDLPPGTADAPLTVLQQLPVSGIIIVFTPQDLTAMIVKKAVNMARQMGKPILGVVENMSYLYVPEIAKKIEIFGKSHGEEMASSTGAPLLAQLPIDPQLAKVCDEGNIELYDSDVIAKLGESVSQSIKQLSSKK